MNAQSAPNPSDTQDNNPLLQAALKAAKLMESRDGKPGLDELAAMPLRGDLGPLCKEAVAVCTAWAEIEGQSCEDEGCGHNHASPDFSDLAAAVSLEARLRSAFTASPEQLLAFQTRCEWALVDWVTELIFELADKKRGDEALAMHTAWSSLARMDVEEPVGSRAHLLASLGQKEAAKAEVERRLAADTDSAYALSVAIDLYMELGELGRAEELARHYVKRAGELDDPEEKLSAWSQLAEVLHAAGKEEEAATYEELCDSMELLEGEDDEEEA